MGGPDYLGLIKNLSPSPGGVTPEEDFQRTSFKELPKATEPNFGRSSPSPEGASTPVVTASDGRVLATNDDPPHIRVYAWTLIHLHPGRDTRIDSDQLRRETKLTAVETTEAVNRLCREGDLCRNGNKYRLIVQYP